MSNEGPLGRRGYRLSAGVKRVGRGPRSTRPWVALFPLVNGRECGQAHASNFIPAALGWGMTSCVARLGEGKASLPEGRDTGVEVLWNRQLGDPGD